MATVPNDDATSPTVLPVAIIKARDNEWHGALDGLRISDAVSDFEEYGVTAAPS
jgi:hypothetical protein